ncbi:MAG: polysaccharide pyruvyl transferase family protein [Clostridia bacterium]|nr:polysaccharide pyruvyl transferase family protein [Clostridia bacterium]
MSFIERIKLFILKIPIIKNIYSRLAWYKGRSICRSKLYKDIFDYKTSQSNPVFLIFTPEHHNLGDHAIAYSEKKLLEEMKLPFYEVTNKQLEILDYYKLMSVFDGSMILVTGGGNLGSLWTWIENINREIVKNNPNSLIVVLPNSIFYGDTEEDLVYLEESKEIYNGHKRLFFYAREKISYSFMNEHYNNVKLIPDMVLKLRYSSGADRNGCVLCLRDDCEATLSQDSKDTIKNIADEIFENNVIYFDTVVDYSVSVDNRRTELLKMLYTFTSAELIITDRLHGMIFAAITGTNCIVLDSKSPKLRGCYEWIKHLDYIRFVDDVCQIESIYRSIPHRSNYYDNSQLLKYFEVLKKDILNYYNEFYCL